MPTNIVPNAIPSIVTTLPAPKDGEIANSASLTQFVTPLVDDSEAFRLLTYGGGMRRKTAAISDTSLTVYPLGAVVIQVGGIWKAYAHTVATTLNPTTLAGGALAASTGYWLYAYDNAGALDFAASATAPDSGYRYKSGNTGYWFVGYFSTNGLGNVIVHVQNDLEFRYVSGPVILTAGSALGITALTITPYVPAQASSFTYLMQINATAAGRFGAVSDSGGGDSVRIVDNGITPYDRIEEFNKIAVPGLGYNGVAAYIVSNAATQLSVAILGFKL
jgi:hypothetical protein